jgi:hypothetical protein
MARVVDRLFRAQDEIVAITQDLRHHGGSEDTYRRRPSMDPYIPMGQSRLQQHDITTVIRAHGFLAPAYLAALGRQREWQAETEMSWLIKQNPVTPYAAASRFAMLRQTIGAAMIRAGERLAGAPRTRVAPETSPVTGMLGTASRPA